MPRLLHADRAAAPLSPGLKDVPELTNETWFSLTELPKRLGIIGATIHPYPTMTEAIRKTGDLDSRIRLPSFVRKLMARWLAWNRTWRRPNHGLESAPLKLNPIR